MVMIKNYLLRLFGLSDIVAEQAYKIDSLQMQCDWLEQLVLIESENLRKVITISKLWEPNDVY